MVLLGMGIAICHSISPSVLYAFDNKIVHQYIAKQAGDVFNVSQISDFIPSTSSYSNTWDDKWWLLDYCYNNSGIFSSGQYIMEGAKEEDDYDPYVGECLGQAQLGNFVHHFFDPDSGAPSYAGLWGAESAIHRANRYWEEFIKDNYINYSNNTDDEGAGRTAYYFLGRIAHLLADMAVPAHVHLDPHGISDSFEVYTKEDGHYGLWNSSNAKLLEQSPETSLLNKVIPNLEALFWNLAQRSQYFPSDDRGGNDDFSMGSEHIISGLTWFAGYPPDPNGMRVDWAGQPCGSTSVGCHIEPSNLVVIGNTQVPLAIQYTAALYKYFWEYFHPAPVLNLVSSEGGQVRVRWSPPPETGHAVQVAGYRIKYGLKASKHEILVADVGPEVTDHPLDGFGQGDCLSRYYFVVVTYDSRGNESLESNEVIYSKPVQASFTMSDDRVAPGTSVDFDASGTYDNYSWDFGDGTAISGPDKKHVSHEFTQEAYTLVRLTVSNNSGDSACAERYLAVGHGGTMYFYGGTINQDVTFSNYYSTWVVLGNIAVASGATLTIESGVEVRLGSGATITVHGTLTATGATFTWADGEHVWRGIGFIDSGSSGSRLENCVIEHAEGYTDSNWHGVLYMYKSSPTIVGCTIRNTLYLASIDILSGSPSIQNNTISGTGQARGISVSDSSSPTVTGNNITGFDAGVEINPGCGGTYQGNTISGNNSYGLYYSGSAVIAAKNNNWGDPSGPLDDSDDRAMGGLYNPTGLGNKVSDHVNYYPWTSATIGRTTTPTGLAGNPDNGAIDLTWNANTEAYLGGYKIYHRAASEVSYRTPVIVGTVSSQQLTGLSNGTKYYIAISSMNAVGVESAKCSAIAVTPRAPSMITATVGTGGAISPTGGVSVPYGTDQSFTITPNEGYHVLKVLVDGVSVGAVTSFTFTNVIKAHTIAASFALNTYTITATAGLHGAITPSGAVTVQHGANKLFRITPDSGYHVKDVVVDSETKGAVKSYTFISVTAAHTITASFESNVRILTDVGSVIVSEGKSAAIQVKLSQQPATDVVVSVSWLSGDPDISVLTGSSLTFTPSGWNSYQPVTLAAAPDADLLNGSATVRLSADWLAPADITVTEDDKAQCATIVTLPDINGNGFAELAVLQRNVTTGVNYVYVKDSKTGALIRRVSFGVNGVPKGMAAVDDHGVSNLALLTENEVTGEVQASVRNALSGSLVNTVVFDKTYAPRGMFAIHDLNGNGIPELAMLGINTANGSVGVQVRDAQTDELLKTVFFNKAYTPRALATVPDINGNGQSELAVLGVDPATHRIRVEIRDAAAGTLIRAVTFLQSYAPQSLAIVPDVDGSGAPGVAVVGTDVVTGKVLVQVKNAKTGALVKNTEYDKAYTPRSLAAVPDTDQNPGSELALLGTNETLGTVMAEIRDAKTGSLVKNVPFISPGAPQDLAVLPDTNLNGNPDLAALRTNKSTGKVVVEIRDALSGKWLKNISIP